MNASAWSVYEGNRGDTSATPSVQKHRSTLTRPVYRAVQNNQAINELTETLKRIMVSATTLLGVPNCWIAGLDGADQKLIPVASFSQEAAEANRSRASLYYSIANWVRSSRVPALINNIVTDPRSQGFGSALGGSMLCVPLLSGQQVLGTITVSSPVTDAFQQQSVMILQVLADQTILAISKARQIEASQQQSHELAAFVDVAKAMTSTLDTSQMLHAIVAGIRRLVSCDEAVIFGFVEEAQELRALARLGAHPDQLGGLRIPLLEKQSLAAWVALNRRPLSQEPGGRVFLGRITQQLMGEDDLALLGVPLLSREQLRGVIMLGRFTPFEPNELRLVLNLSSIIALALEHVDMQALTASS
jgi:GAF domain-containing protein